jgi:replicative DNA helicase
VPINLVSDLGFLDDYHEPAETLELPWPTLQGITGGLHRGNYMVLAARLGQGKSAYLMAMAGHALTQGKRVLFYSLEMSESEVRARAHSLLARKLGYSVFTLSNIRNRQVDPRDYKDLVQELTQTIPGTLEVHTPASGMVSPATVASRAGEYDMVIIDYATLMVTDTGQPVSDDWRTATQVSNRLKQIALAEQTRIVAAAQVNREGDTAGWRPPKVKNLAQADSFGQDADLVVTFKAYAPNATVFSVEKNRHGASGHFFFTRFNPNEGVFTEITRDDADDLRAQAEEAS